MPDYFVTGVSSGIGLALTRELIRRGDRVWGISRRRALPPDIAGELGTDRFHFSACDVACVRDVDETVATMQQRGFLPNVVILNAAIHPERAAQPFSLGVFQEVMQVNVFGALAWVEALLPSFQVRGAGQFVAISSLAAYRGDSRWVAYAASKAALSRSFESLRGRFRNDGISFTTIHLGSVGSGMGKDARTVFSLSEGRAVGRILSAIDRRKNSVAIPKRSRILLEATRILPDWLFSRLVAIASSDSKHRRIDRTD